MEYNIIATLGPASREESLWKGFLEAGANSFRLNTSHMSLLELKVWLDRISQLFSELNYSIPVILDLQGSKWRLGEFPSVELTAGQQIKLNYSSSSRDKNTLPVPHVDFFEAALVSDKEIILNDAKIVLAAESVEQNTIITRVIKGGVISSKKGITYSSTGYRKEALSDKDREIFNYASQYSFIRYAVSYIKDSYEMDYYRKHFGSSAYLIAKLERESAIGDILNISEKADELWLCRGDLGAELGLKSMTIAVEKVSSLISKIKVPVVMAGQVLEHMTEHAFPTRSEICYLYDTLQKGYKGFVLSDECAIGKYPIESCRIAAMFR